MRKDTGTKKIDKPQENRAPTQRPREKREFSQYSVSSSDVKRDDSTCQPNRDETIRKRLFDFGILLRA